MAADKWRVSASYRQRWSRVGIRLEFNLYETDLKFAPHRLDGRREFFAAPLGPTSQPLGVS
jgi:hypothetical protein